MPAFQIVSPDRESFEVDAANWLMALGQGVERVGGDLSRLACEQLVNGTVLARDPARGSTWVVKPVGAVPAEVPLEPSEDLLVLEADPDEDEPFGAPGGERRRPVTLTDEALTAVVNVDDPDEVARRLLEVARAPTAVAAWERGFLLAREMVGTEAGSAIAARPEALVFVAVAGPFTAKLKGVRLPNGTGVAGFAVARGVSLVLQEAREDQRLYAEVDAVLGYTTRRLLVAPVRHGAVTFGCLELLNPVGEQPFRRGDLASVETVADAVATRLRALGESGLIRAG